MKILLMNGPNLDMLGTREPEIYGYDTLNTVQQAVVEYGAKRGVQVECFQSNHEGELIERIHLTPGIYDGIVYNPGAHTHYSYALRDAVGSVDIPVVEVHISAVDEREPFRHVSVIAPVCLAQVKGLGIESYFRGIDILLDESVDKSLRLGEGFEAQFPAGAAIIVAGRATGPIDGLDTQLEGMAPVVPVELPMLTSSDPTEALSPISSAALLDGAQTVAVGLPSEAVGLVSNARLDCVRVALEACGCDALLVRDTSNIRWLTAFDGVFDDERAHELVVAKGIASLHTDSRYSNALRTLAEAAGNVTVDEERVSHAKFASNCLGGIASKGKSSAKVGFEDDITYAEYLSLSKEFSKGKLVPTTDLVKGLRAVKDAIEIARLKAAQAITDAAFRHIVDFMRPGMTEREVQIELEDYMLRHGAEELAFRSIVACGANGADPHAVPGDARLEAGQCVVMDFGAKAAGYCSDMTRMVFLGQPEERIADAYRVLREANEQVEAMLKPGVTGLEAHTLAEKVLADGGYEGKMGHGLGHGVGLDIHEEPCLNLRNDKTLVAGNVVTVEPGIYFAGDFGMRLEDCGVVTDEGYLVFSQLGHDMVIV